MRGSFFHVVHTPGEHAQKMIMKVENDVFIIEFANFHQLVSLNELWIEFGDRKSLRFIPIH